MSEATWIEQIRQGLTGHIGKKDTDEILRGCEDFNNLDEKQKARRLTEVMDKLDARIDDQQVKIDIMTRCSCRCYEEHIDLFRETYAGSGDIDQLIDIMHGKVFYHKPVRDGNVIYITKAPYSPDEYAKAKTPEEKRYHFCHCDNARAAKPGISPTYCLCGAGWCKMIWEGALGKPVRVDIVESVLQGDDVCKFAVHI